MKESIKNPYGDALLEIEQGLWEHDYRVGEGIAQPYEYRDDEFRACIKVFISSLMWKLWVQMGKEGLTQEAKEKRAEFVGKILRGKILEFTGKDPHELYSDNA